MANQVESVRETVDKSVETVTGAVRKVYLIGLGGVTVVRDEITNLLKGTDKLVTRGESLEKDSVDRVSKVVEDRRNQVKKAVEDVEKRVDELTTNVLHRVNIPTAADIEDLSKKIASLSRKVDKLAKEQKEQA
ncbi:MAG: hypothetical protein Kow0080_04550 [Candidatus Promineifilaceae bacterium]